nr:PREDICTED: major facilitator superfamily domain-containing protein 7 [Latimeria chalumnae]|eukprot:XP_014352778.1 PREDICTED: major facilitator superfamily domain-containing protein 7 [Latimeria chalumnae]
MNEEPEASETSLLLPSGNPDLLLLREFKTYKRRWFILAVVCLLNSSNAMVSDSSRKFQHLATRLLESFIQFFAGVCGALFVIFGIFGAFFLGLFVDRTKMFVEATKITFCLTALASIGFALVSQMRNQAVALAVACSLFGMFGFSIYPVCMELSVECVYPVGEATSAGLIFISGQIQGIIYIILFQSLAWPLSDVPFSTCQTDDAALDWSISALVMAGICSLGACCFVLFFHTDYKRLNVEEPENNVNNCEQPVQ